MFDSQNVTAAILLQISLDHKKDIKEVIAEYNSALRELLITYPRQSNETKARKIAESANLPFYQQE